MFPTVKAKLTYLEAGQQHIFICNLYFTLGALNDRLKIGAEFLELNQRIFKLLKVREQRIKIVPPRALP